MDIPSLRGWTRAGTGLRFDRKNRFGLTDTRHIYQITARAYQTLVEREDYEGNLMPAILAVEPLVGRDVVELGAGTGRVSCLIASIAGKLILIETLGTGHQAPHPSDKLVDHPTYLDSHHFESTRVRTDYCFENFAEARHLTGFFFGEIPLPMWQSAKGVIVPECTICGEKNY